MLNYLGLPVQASAHAGEIDEMIALVHWLMAILFVGWGIFFLFVLGDVKGVVELTELMVDQGVGGEDVLRQPWPVQPVAMEHPLEEAGLHDSEQERAHDPGGRQKCRQVPPEQPGRLRSRLPRSRITKTRTCTTCSS